MHLNASRDASLKDFLVLTTYAERFSRLNLPTLELRRLHSDLTWCYKILFDCVDMHSDEFFLFLVLTCRQEVIITNCLNNVATPA